MKARTMQNSSSLVKQEFLNKWLKGLHIYSKFKNEMTVLERKKAIKLSADVAIASTRNPTTHWSRAAMASAAATDAGGATMVEHILGCHIVSTIKCKNKKSQRAHSILTSAHKKVKARRRTVPSRMKPISIAKKLVKNRTRVLKGLVPGGHGMDEVCLIKETLDYIASLRVQVDVMRHIAAAAEGFDSTQERLS